MTRDERLVFDALIMIVTNNESFLNEARRLKQIELTYQYPKNGLKTVPRWQKMTEKLIINAYSELHKWEPELFPSPNIGFMINPVKFLDFIPDVP